MDDRQTAWPRPAEPNQTMAVWSLVMAALPLPPLWPVSSGLGIAVLIRSQDDRNHARLGDGGCTSRFEDFIGIPHHDSEFDFQYLTPIEETWEDDRAVICLLDPGAKLAGTLKDERS